MALRNQPYLPLYVQDFMTDEKLAECSAQTTGVYIRIMCIMHKSDEYGKLLLRQNQRQSVRQEENFAAKLAIHLPYSYDIILSSIEELLEFKILSIEDGALCQKRMIRDNKISESRAVAGAKGASATNNKKQQEADFAEPFAASNPSANAESENEIVIENKSKFEIFRLAYKGTKRGLDTEYKNFIQKNNTKILDLLLPALEKEIAHKQKLIEAKQFCPEWKNLQTWINQKCWEQEFVDAKGSNYGEGEYRNSIGNRTYGTSGVVVPNDAPPRPSNQHIWSKNEAKWKIQ